MAFDLSSLHRSFLLYFVSICCLFSCQAAWAQQGNDLSRAQVAEEIHFATHVGRRTTQSHFRVSEQTLAVVVNVQDPQSVALARVYMRERKIDVSNLIAVSFSPKQAVISPDAFVAIYKESIESLGDRIQALVLTWSIPYRVGCMSITAAFAFGFNDAYCANGCQFTKASDYFDSETSTPWSTHRMRPTMMLAARNFDGAVDLIGRGLSADSSQPQHANAFVVRTPDPQRSVRSLGHESGEERLIGRTDIALKYVNSQALRGQKDVLAYFTGAANVVSLAENRYLPGAVGDHLTSFGGVLDGNTGQMSALEWIRFGLTGSYGTVVEPCNFLQKFPDPEVFLDHYSSGDTLLEAYWKSVVMPGQGLFVGEPLARPFLGFQ